MKEKNDKFGDMQVVHCVEDDMALSTQRGLRRVLVQMGEKKLQTFTNQWDPKFANFYKPCPRTAPQGVQGVQLHPQPRAKSKNKRFFVFVLFVKWALSQKYWPNSDEFLVLGGCYLGPFLCSEPFHGDLHLQPKIRGAVLE